MKLQGTAMRALEPQFIHKGQTRLTRMDDQILFLYAKGLTTREIVETFQEMYGAEVSSSLISKVTDQVIEQVIEWQNRPLDALYPVVYLDCIVLKIRQDKRVINKSLYLALGINIQGHKELLGHVVGANRGREVLAVGAVRAQDAGLERYSDCLR